MKYSLLLLIPVLFIGIAHADQDMYQSVAEAFRKTAVIEPISISVPSVVDIPFQAGDYVERKSVAVYDTTTSEFQPTYIKNLVETGVPLTAYSGSNKLPRITDGNTGTFEESEVGEDRIGSQQIVLTSASLVTASGVTLLLDNYVALPRTIEVRALVNGAEKIVLARQYMNSNTVRFPENTSSRWTIDMVYGQPLRIAEIKLIQKDTVVKQKSSLRFLAQPGHSYEVFYDADRSVTIPTGESGDLTGSEFVQLSAIAFNQNSQYVISDVDKDGFPDITDNCVHISNPDQLDVNENGKGDDCDDFDKDGVRNNIDNCIDVPNVSQKDTDNDGIGDSCDGEESRFTEKYVWIPWVGMGLAAVVIGTLITLTLTKKEDEITETESTEGTDETTD